MRIIVVCVSVCVLSYKELLHLVCDFVCVSLVIMIRTWRQRGRQSQLWFDWRFDRYFVFFLSKKKQNH